MKKGAPQPLTFWYSNCQLTHWCIVRLLLRVVTPDPIRKKKTVALSMACEQIGQTIENVTWKDSRNDTGDNLNHATVWPNCSPSLSVYQKLDWGLWATRVNSIVCFRPVSVTLCDRVHVSFFWRGIWTNVVNTTKPNNIKSCNTGIWMSQIIQFKLIKFKLHSNY